MHGPDEFTVARLLEQGCTAESWSRVAFGPGVDPSRIRNVHFVGPVSIEATEGRVEVDGVRLPCGLYDATIADCTIGAGVRIARIGSVVAGYDIADGAVIQDVAALTAEPGSTFGAGTEVETVNEGGGRVVRLLPELQAQVAWLQAFRSHSAPLREAWASLVDRAVEGARRDRGIVGRNARVLHCGTIRNVMVGDHAVVRGAALLEDGTILSCAEHPTVVGEAVQARRFAIAEGASVTGGVLLDRVYVGQAVRLGKQFSAENSLFFANCEGFHGEAVSIFAGPYTVTHHKSTLLIAAGFSFYNAGSGTNQSNHMYKLGPVHQGVFERGVKTGSFAYALHETHVGAFSVILGKHATNLNTPDLPFAYLHENEGRSEIVPGMTLFSVGTVRDGEKWPKRDGRKAPVRRDLLTFDVFSPWTVEKMRRGRALLESLNEKTPKERSAVFVNGLVVKRVMLKTCARYYAQAVTRYLAGRILDRIEASAGASVVDSLRPSSNLKDPFAWVDVGGLLLPTERLRALENDLAAGSISSLADVQERLSAIAGRYREDEWEYVCAAFEAEHGIAAHAMTRDQALDILAAWESASTSLLSKTLDDSKAEFGASARIGYGLAMTDEERAVDFETVRGSADTNGVVKNLVREQQALGDRVQRLKDLVGRM